MPTADVNWMLAAEVQSGAALVAIVGGLLGSRYVSLHAEQQSARRRLADVVARLEAATAEVALSQADLTDFQVHDMLDDYDCYDFLAESPGASLDEVLDAIDADESGVDREALEDYLGALRQEMRAAVEALTAAVPLTHDHPDWNEFRRQHELKPGIGYVWDWAYDRITAQRREEAVNRFSARSPYPGLLAASLQLPSLPTPYLARTVAQEDRLLDALRTAEAELVRLQGEERAATRHLKDVGQPEGFGLALSVLSYISLSAIALPLGLMVGGPLTLPLWARVAVAIIFLSGVALLMRYLTVYARYLLGAPTIDRFPENLRDLLRRRPLR